MPPPTDETPKRLIVPGADPEPASTPRIVLPGDGVDAPDDEPSLRGPSRIVLPPGVSTAVTTDVPEYPKLRPLILMPINDGQRELLVVEDPIGVIPGQPVLGIESLGLLQLFDGATSITDITAALIPESRDLRVGNMVRDFVGKLDELLMLDSPRFEKAYQEIKDAYHPLEIRHPAFDGRSYPPDAEGLRAFLDAHVATAESWRAEDAARAPDAPASPSAGAHAIPRAVLAPHLDPRRAGPAMARAYLELDPAAAEREPLRVVVFGTGHSLFGDLFALTRKHFDTPLGRVVCDTAFVDALAARLGPRAYHSEIVHRDEHSIEFQAVYLKHRFGERRLTMVPILCGGFHQLLDEGKTPRDSAEFETLIEAVRDAEQKLGGPTVYVAGIDLSHVGPRFGDPAMDDRAREEIAAKDHEAIEAARRGDADGWFQSIAAHGDSTRICGFAPTYALLRCATPGAGRLLHYERSDEKDGSFVTIASMVW